MGDGIAAVFAPGWSAPHGVAGRARRGHHALGSEVRDGGPDWPEPRRDERSRGHTHRRLSDGTARVLRPTFGWREIESLRRPDRFDFVNVRERADSDGLQHAI